MINPALLAVMEMMPAELQDALVADLQAVASNRLNDYKRGWVLREKLANDQSRYVGHGLLTGIGPQDKAAGLVYASWISAVRWSMLTLRGWR